MIIPLLWEVLCSELLRALAPANNCPCCHCVEKAVAKDTERDAAVARNTGGVLSSFYLGLVTRGFSTQQQLIPSTIKKFKNWGLHSLEGGLNGTQNKILLVAYSSPESCRLGHLQWALHSSTASAVPKAKAQRASLAANQRRGRVGVPALGKKGMDKIHVRH